ncbi:acid phosphatase, partial [Tremellales sp. Uapishka_1]
MVHLLTILGLAALVGETIAAPSQLPLGTPHPFDPLKHLSAISPFYIPTRKPDPLPAQCDVTRVSVLIRHSSILGNDDEYEQTMEPFIRKIAEMDADTLPQEGEWAFLREWKTPIVEATLEVASETGKKDSKFLGKYIRRQYESLFPSRKRKGSDAFKKGKKQPPFKVWTASSPRDIETAKAYIKGAFPSHQSGPDGHGDGEVVQLVKVPNKAQDWDRSLTPHKACAAFEKESSLVPANKWLKVYAARVKARLSETIPAFAAELSDQDVLGMQMLCGYETIAQGNSPFCQLFTDEEWLDFEYQQDIRFHYMLGYGQSLSPYLGMPWVRTALHLLAGHDSHGDSHDFDPLPAPKLPPNATHSQLLFPSFTHRESPGFVAVFLNLYNGTSSPHPASEEPPLDYRPANRAWRTSHLVSFLGHIALERYHCHGKSGKKGDYVRAVVNGKHERMSGCEDGLEGSCRWETFETWINDRAERWDDWASVCDKKIERVFE